MINELLEMPVADQARFLAKHAAARRAGTAEPLFGQLLKTAEGAQDAALYGLAGAGIGGLGGYLLGGDDPKKRRQRALLGAGLGAGVGAGAGYAGKEQLSNAWGSTKTHVSEAVNDLFSPGDSNLADAAAGALETLRRGPTSSWLAPIVDPLTSVGRGLAGLIPGFSSDGESIKSVPGLSGLSDGGLSPGDPRDWGWLAALTHAGYRGASRLGGLLRGVGRRGAAPTALQAAWQHRYSGAPSWFSPAGQNLAYLRQALGGNLTEGAGKRLKESLEALGVSPAVLDDLASNPRQLSRLLGGGITPRYSFGWLGGVDPQESLSSALGRLKFQPSAPLPRLPVPHMSGTAMPMSATRVGALQSAAAQAVAAGARSSSSTGRAVRGLSRGLFGGIRHLGPGLLAQIGLDKYLNSRELQEMFASANVPKIFAAAQGGNATAIEALQQLAAPGSGVSDVVRQAAQDALNKLVLP